MEFGKKKLHQQVKIQKKIGRFGGVIVEENQSGDKTEDPVWGDMGDDILAAESNMMGEGTDMVLA